MSSVDNSNNSTQVHEIELLMKNIAMIERKNSKDQYSVRRTIHEKRLNEILDQLKLVVSNVVMAYGNLCEMRSVSNYKLDSECSFKLDYNKDNKNGYYDELPCNHAKESICCVNCCTSSVPGSMSETLQNANNQMSEICIDKIIEYSNWTDKQIDLINFCTKKLLNGNLNEASHEIKVIRKSFEETKDGVISLIIQCESKIKEYEDTHGNIINKSTQTLMKQYNSLREKWTSYQDYLKSTENQIQNQIENFSNFSKQEEIVNDLLDEIEARSCIDFEGVTDQAVTIPQQIEFNASLLSNLTDQEFILKRLNETFDEFDDSNTAKFDIGLLDNIHKMNKRWRDLTSLLSNRISTLKNIIKVSPLTLHISSFDMAGSVSLPWKRIVAMNEYPYYVNTATLATTWDHPHMSIITDSLCRYDDIRYCAYRTSIKLRALQRWLVLNLCDIKNVSTAFTSEFVNSSTPEQHLHNNLLSDFTVSRLMTILRRMFEIAAIANSVPINISRATDLCLNWLIQLYDPERRGGLCSFKCQLALILMCNAPIEDKYSYIFDLSVKIKSTMPVLSFQEFVASSLSIPKWLHEVDAFGGSNPLASVKSYYNYFPREEDITKENFLSWLRMEPQSIVWLPVLHRLIASERTRHEAKCNVCKEYPIIGFRYRSLKRFNFDVCQKCFFLGRRSTTLSADDPLQEYYIEATSSDDIRDFFRIFANKLKRGINVKTKLGYLPIPKLDYSNELFRPGTVSINDPTERCSVPHENDIIIETNLREKLMPSILDQEAICRPEGKENEGEHVALANYCRILSEHKYLDDKDNCQNNDQNGISAADSIEGLQADNKILRAEYIRLTEEHYDQCLKTMLRNDQNSIHKTVSLKNNDPNKNNMALMITDNKLFESNQIFNHYKKKLENRLSTLEQHNNNLEIQLQQVKQMIDHRRNSPTDVQMPIRSNSIISNNLEFRENEISKKVKIDRKSNNSAFSSINKSRKAISNLFHCADDINIAVGNLVTVMSNDVTSK